MRRMNEVAELRRIGAFAERFDRSPRQLNALHEADAELVELGDGSGMLLAVKTDAVVEEIESGLYADPELIGWMAVTSSLSDLAAVGAEPLGVLLALTTPADASQELVAGLAAGAAEACRAAGTFLLGGDTNQGARLGLCGSAVGLVPRDVVLTRRGASPGDLLYLTGPAGLGAAYGLCRVEGGSAPAFRPRARLEEGRLLRGRASSCVDTSDGVLHALDTLMRVNACRVLLEPRWPEILHPAALELARARGLTPWLMLAGVHGEFELCFTVPPRRERELLSDLARAGRSPVRLGEVAAGEGVALRASGKETRLDTAAIRDASENAGGDPRAYVARLLELARRVGAGGGGA